MANPLLVDLPNHGRFWLITETDGIIPTEGALAPLDHCTKDGRIKKLAMSYAHLFSDKTIRQFGVIIGKAGDLEFIREGKE